MGVAVLSWHLPLAPFSVSIRVRSGLGLGFGLGLGLGLGLGFEAGSQEKSLTDFGQNFHDGRGGSHNSWKLFSFPKFNP